MSNFDPSVLCVPSRRPRWFSRSELGVILGSDTALLLLALAMAAFTYFPVTRNYFYADDFTNLYRIANQPLSEYLVTIHGGHLLLTRNAIFYLFARVFGPQPVYYYWAALLTHLLNVALLFRLIRHLTRNPRLACFAGAAWGSTPVHAGALGWYSVYGHVVVGTVLLLLLNALVWVAERPLWSWRSLLMWPTLLLIASTSFGVGIAIALVFPVVAALFMPPSPTRKRLVGLLVLVACVVPMLYATVLWIHVSRFGGIAEPPLYLAAAGYQKPLALAGYLIAYGWIAVLVGPLATRIAYPGPVAFVIVAVSLVALFAVLLAAAQRQRRLIVACLILSCAGYAIIAAGRALVLHMPGLMRDGRLHYAATLPLVIVLCLALEQLGRKWHLKPAIQTALLLLWAVIALGIHLTMGEPIEHFVAKRHEVQRAVDEIRERIDRAPLGANVYILNQRTTLFDAFPMPPEEFPGVAAIFAIYFPANNVDGRQVFFMVSNPEVIRAAQRGKRSATLIVSLADVPRSLWAAPLSPPPRLRRKHSRVQ